MPLSKYFKGSGAKVMRSMKEQYGEEKGKSVFYATANKKKGAWGESLRKRRKKHER